MYLSNRDIKYAIDCHKLIVSPRPEDMDCGYDETSIDLHLGPVDSARIWNTEGLAHTARIAGSPPPDNAPEVRIGGFEWETFARTNQIPIPHQESDSKRAEKQLVYRRGNEVVVRRFGFLLWPTKQIVGTPTVKPDLTGPQRHPELICFVNAKSTRARTGLLVHFTAPTIHANWDGNITLEISNLGPFTFILKEGDPLAQLTVATISSAPDLGLKKGRSQTIGQTLPEGRPAKND